MNVKVEPKVADQLQQFYLSSRALFALGIVPAINMQRSFDEIVQGAVGAANTWRATHVSWSALKAVSEGNAKDVQRAHGVLEGRKDRFVRTLSILQGQEQRFEDWWNEWLFHDATVLITRSEHGSGRIFTADELIPLPTDPADIFSTSGFSFRCRKSVEVAWSIQFLSDKGLSSERLSKKE